MAGSDQETTSLCPTCAKDAPARYTEERGQMFLHVECPEHGIHTELAETDSAFFRRWYEMDYPRPYRHLVLPLTYRCDAKCRYCYTLSNTPLASPPDRPAERIAQILDRYDGNSTLLGGEPTLRRDLAAIIRVAKSNRPGRRIGLGTNGRRLKDPEYLESLREAGMDYVFFSLNDVVYEGSEAIYRDKIQALDNCRRLSVPVWLQRTIDDLSQLASLPEILERYTKVIFNVTVRAVKAFGCIRPDAQVSVSAMVAYFGQERECRKGYSPFNNLIRVGRKDVKVCSWGNDMRRLDPIDVDYLISDDTLTTFHRGMRVDEVILKRRAAEPPA